MNPVCRAEACDTGCLPVRQPGVSARHRGWRWFRLIVAVAVSIPAFALTALLPGRGRLDRLLRVQTRRARAILRALGVRWQVEGTLRSGPSLVVGNHVSFLDILVLTALGPMRMVAKSEVGQWPLLGRLSRLTGTLFIKRNSLRQLPVLVEELKVALQRGYRVQLFPEGTTRCGDTLDPFHRAGFQAALAAAVVVSPITVRHTVAGRASSAAAFLGDETVLAALRRVVGLREVEIRLHVLPAVPAIAGTGKDAVDRRILTTVVERAVAKDLGIAVLRPAVPVESAAQLQAAHRPR